MKCAVMAFSSCSTNEITGTLKALNGFTQYSFTYQTQIAVGVTKESKLAEKLLEQN